MYRSRMEELKPSGKNGFALVGQVKSATSAARIANFGGVIVLGAVAGMNLT